MRRSKQTFPRRRGTGRGMGINSLVWINNGFPPHLKGYKDIYR